MKKFLNKKIKYIITGLILIVMFNIAISFAYIRGTTLYNESLSTVALTGGRVYVKYKGNTSDIIVNDILPGFETTKQFTVTSEFGNNHEYYKDGVWYTIALVIDKNEFDDGSIICSVTSDKSSDNDGILAKSSNISIPSGANQSGINIASGRFDNNNMSHIYNLKISYPETGANQSHMVNAEFAAHVILTNPQLINLTFDLDGGSFTNLNLNENSSIKVPANSTINLPTPTKDGYAFMGWKVVGIDASISSNLILTNTNAVSLKALWTIPGPYEFDYTGAEQEFIAEYSGLYKIETWGAQGGGTSSLPGGYGGYVSGSIMLHENDSLYVYVGENYNGYKNSFCFNGGGKGSYSTSENTVNYNGGGATDVRYFGTYQPTEADLAWDSTIGLNSRIMVAAGGGGYTSWTNGSKGGNAGGLIGGSGNRIGSIVNSTGGTQTSGGNGTNNTSTTPMAGVFGVGGYGSDYSYAWVYYSGGGGGFYGGGSGGAISGSVGSAAGGSSYISGHTGCVAITSISSRDARTGTNGASCTTGTSDNLCSSHYSDKVFADTVIIDGSGYFWTNDKGSLQQMPNPSGGYYASGVGHSGNGYARITYLHS